MIELLRGVRVLECAVLFNGDQTGRLLGDLGADVIKVEAPGVGDYLRNFLGQITPHNSPAHLYVNRNKRSLTLDLRSEDGREIFFDLLRETDIFVDGFAADACKKLGVGYEAQKEVKPDIIYCQCSGYGAEGPYAAIPTHGAMMGALVGSTPIEMGSDGMTYQKGGDSGDGTTLGATNTALTAVAALSYRDRTGKGVYIDGAGSDSVLSSQWYGATYRWNNDRITDRRGMSRAGGNSDSAKYQFYETEDEKFILFCGIEHKFWDAFCRAVGRTDLLSAKDGQGPVDFAGGDIELRRELQSIFHTRTLAEWIQVAIEHDIAMGPSHSLEDLREDPHLLAREILHEEDHPQAGAFTSVGWPAPVRDQPFEVQLPAPALGEHTGEILTELGCSEDRIHDLRERKVV